MLLDRNQTDGNSLERFLTPYQNSRLPLIRSTIAYLCPRMSNVDTVHFSECCSKEVKSFLTHSERRPKNIYSQDEINPYCIIKLAT